MEFRIALLFAGAVCAFAAIFCAQSTFENPKDRKFFGIPIGIIGILGYVCMAVVLNYNMLMVYYALVFITALITILLIVKSIRLRSACPACVACWVINIALIWNAYTS